jgi:uncharacterized membrane protein
MLASFLIGLIGGQRAMAPLATVAVAGARGEFPADTGIPRILTHPMIATGAVALAIIEMVGDKRKTAPDRIAPVGLTARFIGSAIADAAFAPRRQRWIGAGVAGLTAVAAAYPGWLACGKATPRFGQTSSGFIEDAVVLIGATTITRILAKP